MTGWIPRSCACACPVTSMDIARSCTTSAFRRCPSSSGGRRVGSGRSGAGLILQLANHGRALRLEHEGLALPGHWWGPRVWKRIEPDLTPFVRGFLQPLREQILLAREQVDQLTVELEAR